MRYIQILRDLSKKKLDLIEQLIAQTQLWLLNGGEEFYLNKQALLADLKRNDESIGLCEQSCSTLAKEQERGVYVSIKEGLERLVELNQQSIFELRVAMDELEEQRAELLQGTTSVSGYVKDSGAYTEVRRMKGSLLKRGWQRGYGA